MPTLEDFYAKMEELKILVEELVATVPPPPPPEPPPPPAWAVFTVTAEKALARFVYDYNAVGKPIMQIWPGDSITTGRYKFLKGEKVPVYSDIIRADGGADFYKMVNEPEGVPFYLKVSEGVLS